MNETEHDCHIQYKPKCMTWKWYSQRVHFNTLFIACFLPKTKTGYLNFVNLQKEKMKEANLDYWNTANLSFFYASIWQAPATAYSLHYASVKTA